MQCNVGEHDAKDIRIALMVYGWMIVCRYVRCNGGDLVVCIRVYMYVFERIK